MKSILLLTLSATLLFLSCSEEDEVMNRLGRELTPLEEKVQGTWGWKRSLDYDTLIFNRDLTFEGFDQNGSYDGIFTLTNDSIMTLQFNTVTYGNSTPTNLIYRLKVLDEVQLMLQTVTSGIITYHRVR